MGKTKISIDVKVSIFEDIKNGLGYVKIAKKYGVSTTTVKRIKAEGGLRADVQKQNTIPCYLWDEWDVVTRKILSCCRKEKRENEQQDFRKG